MLQRTGRCADGYRELTNANHAELAAWFTAVAMLTIASWKIYCFWHCVQLIKVQHTHDSSNDQATPFAADVTDMI